MSTITSTSTAATRARRSKRLQARRRAELLARRAEIGRQWADRTSHALPTAKLLGQLSTIEHALTDRWPDLSEQWLPEWILADAGRLHGGAEARQPGCP